MDVLTSIKVPISYEHYMRVRMIDHADFSLVKQTAAQELERDDQEFLDTGIHYLKRFYALLVIDPYNPPTITTPVDHFWHAHILHTQMYMAFCSQVYGEYIHHIPLLRDDSTAMAFMKAHYEATLKKYKEVFGDVKEEFVPNAWTEGNSQPPNPTNPALLAQALYPPNEIVRIVPC